MGEFTSTSVEIVKCKNPTAATCYETLRIPSHYKNYKYFNDDILVCISSCQTDFGLLRMIKLPIEK